MHPRTFGDCHDGQRVKPSLEQDRRRGVKDIAPNPGAAAAEPTCRFCHSQESNAQTLALTRRLRLSLLIAQTYAFDF